MSPSADLIVIGAGPAGTSAAIVAAERGLDTILIDSAANAGGQIWRAPVHDAGASKTGDADVEAGRALRSDLAKSRVRFMPGLKVWSVAERFRVDTVGPGGGRSFHAPRIIAATGAHERVVPFPGWTLPGVIGLAAATVLLKSQGILPGRRVVVAGCGPLLAAVAAKIVASGGEVAAVVDLATRREWMQAAPGLMRRTPLLRQGAGWVIGLISARVPIYFGSTVVTADGDHRVQRVVIGKVGHDRQRRASQVVIEGIDALAVGHGLVPGSEIPRLLGAAHAYDRRRGGWVPALDGYGRTSIPGLYAAGDGSGVRGALPAVVAGRLSGLAAAGDAGILSDDEFVRAAAPLMAELNSMAPFSDAVADLMAMRPGLVADIAADTVVCRCEDVTRGEIDAALDAGALDVNQLKHFTRCGMGPCQGRMCGDVVGELVAVRRGSRQAAGIWTSRPPLHPVPLADLLGTFDYSDIPIPKPAPL